MVNYVLYDSYAHLQWYSMNNSTHVLPPKTTVECLMRGEWNYSKNRNNIPEDCPRRFNGGPGIFVLTKEHYSETRYSSSNLQGKSHISWIKWVWYVVYAIVIKTALLSFIHKIVLGRSKMVCSSFLSGVYNKECILCWKIHSRGPLCVITT